MQIIVAKNAGFCYGVKRAYDMAIDLKKSNPEKIVYTYGELIHNKGVVRKLQDKGIDYIDDLDDSLPELLLIRAHGAPPNLIDEAKAKGIDVVDATCPYVRKIHLIVKKESEKGNNVLVIGDPNHPEIIGILGNCKNNKYVVSDFEELRKFVEEHNLNPDRRKMHLCSVVQTTFNEELYKIMNLNEYNTICSCTGDRQKEVLDIANKSDCVIVLGGKKSSNTKKLYEILQNNGKKSIHIEKKDEIKFEFLKKCDKIGIVAGASTPHEDVLDLVEHLCASNIPVCDN